jgi:hypothetical protein
LSDRDKRQNFQQRALSAGMRNIQAVLTLSESRVRGAILQSLKRLVLRAP